MNQKEWETYNRVMSIAREKSSEQSKKEESKRLPPFGPLGKKLIGS